MTDPELIEQQIDMTKASLLNKLEALETQVADVVQSTSDTVSETVDAVKDTVNNVKDNVRSAGEFLNLKRQAEENPWQTFGCSVAAGFIGGYLLSGAGDVSAKRGQPVSSPEAALTAENFDPQPAPKKPSWLHQQLSTLGGVAMATVLGALREVAAANLPDGLGKSVAQELDRLTTSMGAEPIAGPILPKLEEWFPPPERPAAAQPPRPAPRPGTRLPKQPVDAF